MKDTKNVIGDRIGSLLSEKNKRQKELAEYLGVTANTVSYYVTGTRVPNIDQIIKIAQFFDVSTDYLLGISHAASRDVTLKGVCEYTGLNDKAIEELHSLKTLTKNQAGHVHPIKNYTLDMIQNFVLSESLAMIARQLKILQDLDEKYCRYSKMLNFISQEKADEYFSRRNNIEKELFELCGDRAEIINFQDKVDLKICQLENMLVNTFIEIGNCNHLRKRNYRESFSEMADIAFRIDDGDIVFNAEGVAKYISCGRWEEDGDEFINKYTINREGAEQHGNDPETK